MDDHLLELYDGGWASMQASPQFQGSNSAHDLAALCITEAISHGLHVNKEPVDLLLFDAMSAFDLAVIDRCGPCIINTILRLFSD